MFAGVVRISRLFRGFAVTGQACQYQMSQVGGRWQTRFSRKIERDSARRVGETGLWSQSV